MSVIKERVYVAAPYTQAREAFERRLGLAAGEKHGTCSLMLAFPLGEDHEIARAVTATTQRQPDSANYTSHYLISWDAGRTARGVPTPAFAGTLTLSAGQDYGETVLQLVGAYEPPGGIAGRAFDEMVGRRVAHTTLSELLAGVGEVLRESHDRTEAAKPGH
jgi:hypothetical protein